MKVLASEIATVNCSSGSSLLTFGLPLKQGVAVNVEMLGLQLNGQNLAGVMERRGGWPDGSIRWLWCNVIIVGSGTLNLIERESNKSSNIDDEHETNCEIEKFSDRERYSAEHFRIMSLAKKESPASVFTGLKIGRHACYFRQLHQRQAHNHLYEDCYLAGEFDSGKEKLKVYFDLRTCRETGEFDLKVRLHNPARARHEQGLWDLGDPGSVSIDEFGVDFRMDDAATALILKEEEPAAGLQSGAERYDLRQDVGASVLLEQIGSGGEHWRSPIHWGPDRRSTVLENGFKLRRDEEITKEGLRASPLVTFEKESLQMHLCPVYFWQNFPAKIVCAKGNFSWKLFPTTTELQGGESKTWLIRGRFKHQSEVVANNHNSLSEPESTYREIEKPIIRYDRNYLNETGVFPLFHFGQSNPGFDQLIQQGLTGGGSFRLKRESVDVYGWRHFGELYADHEAVADSENPYFISHYNNQYDPLMGMTLQFLNSNNTAWLDLVYPLSRHIQDIDVYDTEDDKSDYNGGLFWHTDHYVPAETCSHRSHSRFHKASYEGFLGGGGPGGQHCYTTGLALQYWLFGDEGAKRKVQQLTRWIRNFYNGSGSILERTFRLLKADIKQYQVTNYGFKVPGFKYPLDRGTGNYLVALLDEFDLTENVSLLQEMSYVIQQTCHPKEDLSKRNLDDFEHTWFYTVFLQALVRFLLLKEALQQTDASYWYGRHSLMHYCEWMYQNESFYLDHPDKLEFPNDTWCAQELRKANLFCSAYYFSEKEEERFLSRSEEYYRYVETRLSNSKEAQFTRVLALLMQNDGVRQKFVFKPRSPVIFQHTQYPERLAPGRLTIIYAYLLDVFKLVLSFSVKREWRWLSSRL